MQTEGIQLYSALTPTHEACVMLRNYLKVDSWVSTVLHADSPPCAKSPTLKQVVLGRILTVLAQVWRVGSS